MLKKKDIKENITILYLLKNYVPTIILEKPRDQSIQVKICTHVRNIKII